MKLFLSLIIVVTIVRSQGLTKEEKDSNAIGMYTIRHRFAMAYRVPKVVRLPARS